MANGKQQVIISCRVDKSVKRRVKLYCVRNAIKMAGFIQDALEHYLHDKINSDLYLEKGQGVPE